MWIICNGGYLNSCNIKRLEEYDDGTIIHMVDGEKIKTKDSIDGLSIQTGTVIAAQAGYDAAWMNSKTGAVEREQVAAWRVTGGEDHMVPMVPSGRQSYDAIVYPDGRVLDRDGHFHGSVDAWVAVMFEEQQRKAKAADKTTETA